MPPAPKVGDIRGEIGLSEIQAQLYPEQTGDTSGNIGIAREIAIDLKREQVRPHQQGKTTEPVRLLKDTIDHRSDTVGQEDLLKVTDQDELAGRGDHLFGHHAPLFQLRDQSGRSLDWAGDQLGEERDVEGKEGEIPLNGLFAAINIDRVGQRLEGKKTDTDRQQDSQGKRGRAKTEDIQQMNEGISEKVEILKEPKQPQTNRHRGPKPELFAGRVNQSVPLPAAFGTGFGDFQAG